MARSKFGRSQRVASLVRINVAEILAYQVKDPRVAGVTVIEAEVTGDLREARVFVYFPGDETRRAEVLSALQGVSGYVRRELGQRMQARVTPTVEFRFDDSLEYGARIESRLRELGLGDHAEASEDEPAADDSAEHPVIAADQTDSESDGT
jgi:ribosome-binding factor A